MTASVPTALARRRSRSTSPHSPNVRTCVSRGTPTPTDRSSNSRSMVARGQFGSPDPVAVSAKVGPSRKSTLPGRHAVLFTLPLDLPPFGAAPPSSGLLARRSAKLGGVQASGLSAFEPGNAYQIPVPSGGKRRADLLRPSTARAASCTTASGPSTDRRPCAPRAGCRNQSRTDGCWAACVAESCA